LPELAAGAAETTFDFVYRRRPFSPSDVRFYRIRAVPTWSTGSNE
jgi:hypothetical protein